jgi:hypothetical protein
MSIIENDIVEKYRDSVCEIEEKVKNIIKEEWEESKLKRDEKKEKSDEKMMKGKEEMKSYWLKYDEERKMEKKKLML